MLLISLSLGTISCTRQDSSKEERLPQASPDQLVQAWRQSGSAENLHIKYPLDGSLFPLEMAPATVIWKDASSSADTWLVRIGHAGKSPIVQEVVKQQRWTPDLREWDLILKDGLRQPVTISILGARHDKLDDLLSSAQVSIRASDDPIGAPIFFREVPLPFDYANRYPEKIRYLLGNVAAEPPPKVLMENLPLCGNCHSFSKDGSTLGMDVDYANDKGSYVIASLEKVTELTPSKIITWSDANKESDALTFGLLSQLSPDGRTVVSTIEDRSIFVGLEDNLAYSQLFFPIKGILASYDRETESFSTVPGADDPAYVQSNPTWSPDGNTLLFSRAEAYRSARLEGQRSTILPREAAAEFLDGGRKFKYDIYKLPFNQGKGGVALPLEGASANGKSNYFPKVTPDGKWVVFVQAESFMLLQPDSQLYIVPTEGGVARKMTCNTSSMNSWHSFSPNGRWMVFSSKERGPYTQLWLTHLDEQGNDTPPVVLDHLSTPKYAANIPEFVNIEPGSLQELTDQFSDGGNYHYRVAKNLLRYGDLKSALEALDRAAIRQPNDPEVFLERGALRFRMKKSELALRDFGKASALASKDFRGPYNLGLAKEALGDLAGAHKAITQAARLNPNSAAVWSKKVSLQLALKDSQGALKDLDRALALSPANKEVRELRRKLEAATP